MKLTNKTTGIALDLPHDLLWSDEHSWSSAVSTSTYSLTGALIRQTAMRQAGRPITLEPPADEMAWIDRETVDALHSWTEIQGLEMTLELDYVPARTVVFRHEDTAMESRPVKGFPSPDPTDPFLVTLRFMEI